MEKIDMLKYITRLYKLIVFVIACRGMVSGLTDHARVDSPSVFLFFLPASVLGL
jgi:hypothetical protein